MGKIEKQSNELKLSEQLLNSLVIDDELGKLLGIETEKEKKEAKDKQEKDKQTKQIIK